MTKLQIDFEPKKVADGRKDIYTRKVKSFHTIEHIVQQRVLNISSALTEFTPMVLKMGPSPRIRIKASVMPIAPPSTNADDTDRSSSFSVHGSVVIQPGDCISLQSAAIDCMLSNRDKKEGMQLKCIWITKYTDESRFWDHTDKDI